MSKRGLPTGVRMRHDEHYVESLAAPVRTIGRKIAIDLIEPNPEQPRREIGDLSELSASIKEKGVLEPLLVKPIAETGRWMIIAGERRWRSAKLAGLSEVPCIEMDLDEHGVAEIALIENLQRKDLNVWEEADGLAALVEKFGYTQEQIAQKISKSRSSVNELLTIAGLPQEIRKRCADQKVSSKATLLEIARQFDEAAMFAFMDEIETGRKPGKAKSVSVSAKSAAAAVDDKVSQPNPRNVFKFDGVAGEYEVTVSFSSSATMSRAGVLKALKSAFDAVKAGDAGV